MTRRLPASASDASREALNSSKQREAPAIPDLLNLWEDSVVSVSSFMMNAFGGAKSKIFGTPKLPAVIYRKANPWEKGPSEPTVCLDKGAKRRSDRASRGREGAEGDVDRD